MTGQLEREIETGSTYRDIFQKVNLRRTEICTGVYTIQVLTSIYLISYGVYFFERKLIFIQAVTFIDEHTI